LIDWIKNVKLNPQRGLELILVSKLCNGIDIIGWIKLFQQSSQEDVRTYLREVDGDAIVEILQTVWYDWFNLYILAPPQKRSRTDLRKAAVSQHLRFSEDGEDVEVTEDGEEVEVTEDDKKALPQDLQIPLRFQV